MERATDEAKSGRHEKGVEQSEYDAMVTMPFKTDSLSLVSSRSWRMTRGMAGREIELISFMISGDSSILCYYSIQDINKYFCILMLSRALRRISPSSLLKTSSYQMNHIKNLHHEIIKKEIAIDMDKPELLQTNKVYKPTYTIEFDRVGQVLLYSANPIANDTVYFRYPYILYQSAIPFCILNYAMNPFDLIWYWNSFGLYFSTFLVIPRIWYIFDYKFKPQRISLLRGGRIMKIESQALSNKRYIYWVENFLCRVLTQDKMRFDDPETADFLTEQGQLKYDLTVEFKEFKLFGVNLNDEQLQFFKHGTVHHPEIFEACLKGYNIDTTDFVINTADNIRYREGNFDQ